MNLTKEDILSLLEECEAYRVTLIAIQTTRSLGQTEEKLQKLQWVEASAAAVIDRYKAAVARRNGREGDQSSAQRAFYQKVNA